MRRLQDRVAVVTGAARGLARTIERDRPRLLLGRRNRAIDLMKRIFPNWTESLIARNRHRVPFL